MQRSCEAWSLENPQGPGYAQKKGETPQKSLSSKVGGWGWHDAWLRLVIWERRVTCDVLSTARDRLSSCRPLRRSRQSHQHRVPSRVGSESPQSGNIKYLP
eukprot:285272-Amphidinium_carterae.1